jgi:hypothetical protein
MCPLYAVVGGQEHSVDIKTTLRLVKAAKEAQVDVTLDIAPYLQHCPMDQDLMRCPEHMLCAARFGAFIKSKFR